MKAEEWDLFRDGLSITATAVGKSPFAPHDQVMTANSGCCDLQAISD
jgi:hypothetical protein